MNLAFDLRTGGRRPGVGGRRDLGGRHAHRGLSSAGVLSQATSGSVQQVAAALEPLGHDAGPGRHVADRLGRSRSSPAAAVGRGRLDRTRAGPGIEPGQRQLERFGRRAEREARTERGISPGDRRAGCRRGSGWRSAWSGPGNGRAPRSWSWRADRRMRRTKGDGSARDWPTSRSPVRAGPTHNQGQDRGPGQTRPAVRGRDGRSFARWRHRPSRRPEDIGRAVDAALGDLGADRQADGPSGRSGLGLWDELAKAQSS